MHRLAALSLLLALSLSAQLPPGTSRLTYESDLVDGTFFAATAGGTFWLGSFHDNDVDRIDENGVARTIAVPWRGTRGLATGPDGALWLSGSGWIARIDPATNALQRWALGTGVTAAHIQTGPDRNLWFVQGRSVVRMRPDGHMLSLYDAGPVTGAAFGVDGAWYLSAANSLIRLTAAGERTSFPAATRRLLFAGPGFLWSADRKSDEPHSAPAGEIVKLGYRGETLATYRLAMTPMASDALGNLWLRATTEAGDVLGQLTPHGVLTRFGPLPALATTECYPRHYGGIAFLEDGRVAVSDYYMITAFSLISPCVRTLKPVGLHNTVTIVDPRIAPVLSIELLSPIRRRTVRR